MKNLIPMLQRTLSYDRMRVPYSLKKTQDPASKKTPSVR